MTKADLSTIWQKFFEPRFPFLRLPALLLAVCLLAALLPLQRAAAANSNISCRVDGDTLIYSGTGMLRTQNLVPEDIRNQIKHVTNGTGATTFSPNNTCTRGQIITFLHRAYVLSARLKQGGKGLPPVYISSCTYCAAFIFQTVLKWLTI